MKKTTLYKGHRWTTDEIRVLMKLWSDGAPLQGIAEQLNVSTASVNKTVLRLRKEGIPLERRKRGNQGRSNKLWTQGEVEYLLRRRIEKATCDQIAMELGRSWNAVNAMIAKLRNEEVPVGMLGSGVRRLYDVDALKAVAIQSPECNIIEFDQRKAS